MKFIPSLELSRALYEEKIVPLMDRDFPDLFYAAATFGMCSECLGLDDVVSTDHMWGPRLTLFGPHRVGSRSPAASVIWRFRRTPTSNSCGEMARGPV